MLAVKCQQQIIQHTVLQFVLSGFRHMHCSSAFDTAGMLPEITEVLTEQLVSLTRVARFQQNVPTNYISKTNQKATGEGRHIFHQFSQPLHRKQGHCGPQAFLMFIHYPLHNPPSFAFVCLWKFVRFVLIICYKTRCPHIIS